MDSTDIFSANSISRAAQLMADYVKGQLRVAIPSTPRGAKPARQQLEHAGKPSDAELRFLSGGVEEADPLRLTSE
ncbi:uncharacterized protein Dana_GF26734 [Drosophila ananassae]|uniref:Uncharacterized protein n=1 Tax=Drosophila ananassae TaxID=7217 RepID=A0A0P8XX20_DROAN|nr:uncharacterized protein Dana_GF26734 [Drosophila ananassae]